MTGETRRCARCGQPVAPDAMFCGNCGGQVEVPQAPQPAPHPAQPPQPAPHPAQPPQPAPHPAQPPQPTSQAPVPQPAVGYSSLQIALALAAVFSVLLVAAAGILWWQPSDDSGVSQAEGQADGQGEVAERGPAHASAPPGFIDLAQGGSVEALGVRVVLPSGTGEGTGEVQVERVAWMSKPTSEQERGLTDVFDIEVLLEGKPLSVERGVAIALPLAEGVSNDIAAGSRIFIRTRASANDEWNTEPVAARLRKEARQVEFVLHHLTEVKGDLFGFPEPTGVARSTVDIPLTEDDLRRLGKNHVFRHRSPRGLFEIAYYLDHSRHGIRKLKWTSLTGKDEDPVAPAYVEDIGIFLERAFDGLTALDDGHGGKLFPANEFTKPIPVWIENLDGDAGAGPLGPPLLLSSNKIENNTVDLAAVTAHELAHVLQDHYYVSPDLGDARVLVDTLALVGLWNMWFVDATAELWAERVAHPPDGYWFRESSTYLSVSLDSNDEGSRYSVAHFLSWLETKLGKPVAARAMKDGDHSASDFGNLRAAVTVYGKVPLEDLFAEYARSVFVGTPPTGFRPRSTTIGLDASKKGLYREVSIERPPISAGHAQIMVGMDVTKKGLLVFDPCNDMHVLNTFTYDQTASGPEDYLEARSAGQGMVVKGCARAIPGVGGKRRFEQVTVNRSSVQGGNSGTYRYYLLLPPHDIQYSFDNVLWQVTDKGMPDGIIDHFNVYAGAERLNDEPIKGTGFKAPGLTQEQQEQLWVSVVDRHGFEWPRERVIEEKECPSCDRLAACCAKVTDRVSGLICRDALKTLKSRCMEKSCKLMVEKWEEADQCR